MNLRDHAQGTGVSVDCPAKTNLTLFVGPTHAEWGNRHELDTVYCALGVYDTVTVAETPAGQGFSLDLTGRYLGDLASSAADMRNNHAVRALYALAEASGHAPDVSIRIEKRIPVGAGLGGGSSDAAGTLLALNELWGLHWPVERLEPIASTLGADMPFCLSGGYAHGTGYGELIEPLNEASPVVRKLTAEGYCGEVVIAAYRAELHTPEVYRTFDAQRALQNAVDASEQPERTSYNDLEAAAIALHARSGLAIEAALAAGASQSFISGSGPSVVAFVPNAQVRDAVMDSWKSQALADRIITAHSAVTPLLHRNVPIDE
ncbi:4-(cytidine 5'-diphospho)-2-C-methyl-D-erythritol kinase [Bifidobacterium dolichotidis]|nr:4-(cytidine 5'-diphospho)-2-C-methyl-D-erythritol kinase [Bifidobacterium dolichotidis]